MDAFTRDVIHYSKLFNERATFADPEFQIFIDKDINTIVDEINAAGLRIDVAALQRHIESLKKQEAESLRAFKTETERAGQNINLSSRKDLVYWFFDFLGHTPLKVGKTGPSLDKETLDKIATKEPTAKMYADAKSAHSMLNTLQNIQKALRDGRVYPQHNLNKAASGRFSSSGANGDKLNVNGIPKSIRDIFAPEADEDTIVSLDYKNMEGLVSAALARQQDLIEDMNNDVDLHQKLADIIGVDRKIAKIINHGVSYGMTAFGLANKIGCTEEEAEEFIEKYWQQRPRIRNLKQDVIQTAKAMGYVATISDFRRPTRDLTDDQIWSTFVQGSAADLFKQALTAVSKFLKTDGSGRVLTPQHDALVCSIKTSEIDRVLPKLKDIMEHIHPAFPLKVDVQVGQW